MWAGRTDKGVRMKKEVGVWIDHKKAVIVTGEGGAISILESNMEAHTRSNGGVHGKIPSGAQVFLAEDQRDRRYMEYIHKYYDDVIAQLREADAILILGPGEAKFELEKRLKHAELHKLVIGIEPADKLTDRQVAAKVKTFFASQRQAVR
jgi:hypothetical protein